MASELHRSPISKRMADVRPIRETSSQISAYRDLAREALDSVAVYNARAQWFECSGNENLAAEYRVLSKEALERAQRYKELADLAEKRLSRSLPAREKRAK